MKSDIADRQTPQQWDDTFSEPPVVCSGSSALKSVLLRRWTGTHPLMVQPPLDQHYIVVHLGGAKRVKRRGDGGAITQDVADGAVTFVPAGSSFRWLTEGPIDFAHVYCAPERLDRLIAEEFDREPSAASLRHPVGQFDPLLFALSSAMLDEVASPLHGDGLYLETLSRTLLVRLLHQHSDLLGKQRRTSLALAPRTLRATLEFIEANLGERVDLMAIARVSGLSPYHFSRAFKRETGASPYAFMLQRRIAKARRLIAETDLTFDDIARQCGFNSAAQFAACFKSRVGATPARYRSAL